MFFSIFTGLHVLNYSYAADKPELLFPGYLLALMIITGFSCFTYAVLIERAIMDVEIKDLLHNTSRLTALGGMAAEIAHEIKNPLAVLLLTNEQIQQKLQLGQIDNLYVQNKVGVYSRMTKRLINIMNALKVNYQSGDNDDYCLTNISEIFEEARILCDVRAASSKVQLTFQTLAEQTPLYCRSVQITQVLQNLIHNAIDVLEESPTKWIQVKAQIENNTDIEISVTDSGPGIPVKIRHKIFETLFTTKSNGKGTGLGLSISKRFIEEHKGTLRLDDSCQNTKFVVRLPLNNASELSKSKKISSAS